MPILILVDEDGILRDEDGNIITMDEYGNIIK